MNDRTSWAVSILLLAGLVGTYSSVVGAAERVLGTIRVKSSGEGPVGPLRMAGDASTFFEKCLPEVSSDGAASQAEIVTFLATRQLVLYPKRGGAPEFAVQWEPKLADDLSGPTGHLVWYCAANQLKTGDYVLALRDGQAPHPVTVEDVAGRRLVVRIADQPVVQYNNGIVRQQPGQHGPYDRAAYLHPVWSPSGAIVTGDFSPEHIHQRGIFTAWVKARFGDVETDFWSLGASKGRMLPAPKKPYVETGPVFAKLVIWNQGVVDGVPLLEERVEVTVYAEPYQGGWLFDLRTRQSPVAGGEAMQLPQVYYGGTSFRGPGQWLSKSSRDVQRAIAKGVSFENVDWLPPEVTLDVLTSEGDDRTSGDRKPARWIDYTGPLSSGLQWGGLAVYDHPSNPRHPTRLRIHPELPYFSLALVQQQSFEVKAGSTLELSYRVFAHDGHPDPQRNERIANSYCTPPQLAWLP